LRVNNGKHPRALLNIETKAILEIFHSERFIDLSPAEVFATLLEEGSFYCSLSTMYRILKRNNETKERRDQARRTHYKKPELLATGPNQVWSWDISKLKGPKKWTYYYLYVMIDIFSRYIVGWMIAECESGECGKSLIAESVEKQQIVGDGLIIHSDRGSPMRSKPVALLEVEMGIIRSFNRPYTSNDNCYSEAAFKTIKYSAGFPDRFGCIEDSIAFARDFFSWYNYQHKHSGLAYYAPADVHYNVWMEKEAIRAATLSEAFKKHPERFVRGAPKLARPPTEVWINPPEGRAREINNSRPKHFTCK
jgi:putative transposase